MTLFHLKKTRYYSLAFMLVILFSLSCEKDDICVDGDTPLLIIRFYDAADTSLLKSVNSLRVLIAGNDSPVSTIADRSSLDSIAIPLDLEATSTDYIFILDSADENEIETGNADTLRFSYTVEPEFISRACGFVGRYNALGTSITTDSLNWIQDTEIRFTDIIKQDSAHVKIFH